MSSKQKNERTPTFKVLALSLQMKGLTAKEAFKEACKRTKSEVSNCMLAYPGSYMFEYQKSIAKKVQADDKEVVKAMAKYGIAFDKSTFKFKLTESVADMSVTVPTPAVETAVEVEQPAQTSESDSVVIEIVPMSETELA